MMAVGICTIIVIGLTLFAWQTKIDFTPLAGVLMVSQRAF
jgi:FtsH-binding integral membrane protein